MDLVELHVHAIVAVVQHEDLARHHFHVAEAQRNQRAVGDVGDEAQRRYLPRDGTGPLPLAGRRIVDHINGQAVLALYAVKLVLQPVPVGGSHVHIAPARGIPAAEQRFGGHGKGQFVGARQHFETAVENELCLGETGLQQV